MHRALHLGLLITTLFAASAPVLSAQATGDTSGFTRAGRWGAEVDYAGGAGASLLRFSTPSAAWRLGASFAVEQESSEQPDYPTGTTHERASFGFLELRAGRRWYGGDAHERLRPITGLGLTGSYSRATQSTAWSAGGYAELGAAYFFNPHVSLGGAGELTYIRSRQRQTVPGSSDAVENLWMVRGNLAKISASVYF